jgi:transcriptional regulator with XRE-family HTH domain
LTNNNRCCNHQQVEMKVTKGARALEKLVSPEVSQQEVAELCNVTQQAVSGWLKARSKPTPDRMKLLKDRYGIPMEAWTEDAADEAPAPDSTRVIDTSESKVEPEDAA